MLVDIIEQLYGSPLSAIRYNFAFIDADVLGRAYEQYLGAVTLGRKDVEAKRTKRKSEGIYYTPTFIVKYIVQQTLGRYLEEHGYDPAHPIRVLDPACGSGSFLIEAFDVLDQRLAREKGQARGEYDIRDHARQMQILTQNIYGVDKDRQAVEVAQLNLLLKALHVREKLPRLENIRCGDSLISGTPKLMQEWFGAQAKEKNPFNWDREFSTVMAEGGFDVIVGNPPYIRIQTLPKDEVGFFNDKYAAATGNYDIYVLFVERALQLLKPGGVMGMILPRKFFNTDYGNGLRKIVADATALWRVVDFGDAQVFDQATTYTCLLFLRKEQNAKFAYASAAGWLKSESNFSKAIPDTLPEQVLEASRISDKEWNFSGAESGGLFARLAQIPAKLADVTERIFQGLVTSGDQIYILEERGGSTEKLVSVHSRATNKIYRLEREVVVPLLKGSLDIRRYHVVSVTRYVVFPYRDGVLIPAKDFAKKYPNCWAYLKENSARLSDREQGKMNHDEWYAYVYPKNLTLFRKRKLLTPAIASRASFCYDSDGKYYLIGSGGGGGGGYGILLNAIPESPLYILGLLNSSVLDSYLKSISSPFRHGYYAYNKQYIERLPIRRIDMDNPGEKKQHDAIVDLVEEMLELQKDYAIASREKLPRAEDLQRKINAVDEEIDQAVFRLYGLTDVEIKIVKEQTPRESSPTRRGPGTCLAGKATAQKPEASQQRLLEDEG